MLTIDSFQKAPRKRDRLFGLTVGQTRDATARVITQASWYSREGLLVGHGDLDAKDIVKIANGLPHHELFVVLSEADALASHVRLSDNNPAPPEMPADLSNPGIDYLIRYCQIIVVPGKVYFVTNDEKPPKKIPRITNRVIPRERAHKIITNSR